MGIKYESLWIGLKKRIIAVDKNHFTKKDIMNIIHGLEGREFMREKSRQRQEPKNRSGR